MHAASLAASTLIHPCPAMDQPAEPAGLPALAITITPADDASAAILKLAAVHGLTVSVTAIDTPGPGEALRLELEATLEGEGGPVRLTVPELRAVLGAMRPVIIARDAMPAEAEAAEALPLAPAVVDAGPVEAVTDLMETALAGLDTAEPVIHPADPDDVYRGPRPAPPAEPAQALPGLTALARITAKHPRLMPAVNVLLRPLVLAGLTIEGEAEAMLAPMAEEFADYDTSLLDCAARHILGGRHTRMPDRREIRAAIGVCAHPHRKNKGD